MSKDGSGDSGLFSPVVIGFLIASVVAIFALSILLSTIGPGEDTPYRATSGSPSAIGHKGFFTLLERLGRPVVRSRLNEQVATGKGGVLVVAEPERRLVAFGKDRELGRAPNVLLVLPKWSGEQDFLHDGWLRHVELLSLDQPRRVAELVDKKVMVTREKAPSTWAFNGLGADLTFDGPVQLIKSRILTPLIGTSDKILLGEYVTKKNQRIWVLADPDPIENHGITAPANTRFALALIDKLRSGTGLIVFDETVHGAVVPERNPLQLLFKFPYVVVTGQILVALAILLLATTARFGGAETVPPPFALGKTRLIDNIASLMDRAGHQAVVLRRYISVKLAETGRAMHAPAGLDDGALARWLDRIGTARGVGPKAAIIVDRSAAASGRRSRILPSLFEEARGVYDLNRDLLDGSRGRHDNR